MTAYIEGALSLKAVAAVTKRTIADVEAEALSLGMFLGADWAGRPAVAERDAQQLVTGEARRVREHDLAWRDFEDRSRAWEATRDAVVRAAHDAVGADPRSGPEKHSQARDAAVEAGRVFERATPPPTWQGTGEEMATRRYSDRPAPGLLERVVGRVKAGAR